MHKENPTLLHRSNPHKQLIMYKWWFIDKHVIENHIFFFLLLFAEVVSFDLSNIIST